jgi:hypothetical protein
MALLCFVLTVLASLFKSKSRLEAENAALRHQLIVLRRKVQGRVRLTNNDRLFFVQLYRWFPSVLKAITIIRPKPSSVGIGLAFAGTGVGNRGHLAAGADRHGPAGADPADEHRERALGRTAHPRRTAQARL